MSSEQIPRSGSNSVANKSCQTPDKTSTALNGPPPAPAPISAMKTISTPPTPAPSPIPSHRIGDGAHNGSLDILRLSLAAFSNLDRGDQRDYLCALLGECCDSPLLSFVNEFISPRLKRDPFAVLPVEISLRILSYITDPITLSRASQVSRRWNGILNDDTTWKILCLRHNYRRLSSVSAMPNFYSQQPVEESEEPDQVTLPRPQSYRSHFKLQYMVNSAWESGGETLKKHAFPGQVVVTCLLFTKSYVIVAQDNTRILVFQNSGKLIHVLVGHSMGVWAIASRQDLLVSGGCDRDIRVWDLVSGTCDAILRGHTSTVRSLKMSDDTTAISSSRDTTIRIWDLKLRVCLYILEGHLAPVRCLGVCGDKVVSGSYDTTAKIWQISTGRLLHTLEGHLSKIYSLAVDDKHVATGSLDATVIVWDVNTGARLAVLQGHTSLVGQLQMEGNTLVSGGSDGSIRVWDLDTMSCKHRLAAHDNSVTALRFDSRRIVSGGRDGRVKIWNVKTGGLIRELPLHLEEVWKIGFDSTRLVIVASVQMHTYVEFITFLPRPNRIVRLLEES